VGFVARQAEGTRGHVLHHLTGIVVPQQTSHSRLAVGMAVASRPFSPDPVSYEMTWLTEEPARKHRRLVTPALIGRWIHV
jgi:hypothetical protein